MSRCRTDVQFGYGAVMDHWPRWAAVRRVVEARKPRRDRSGLVRVLAVAMGAKPRGAR